MAHNRYAVLVIAPQGPDRSQLINKLALWPDYDPVALSGDSSRVLKLVSNRAPALVSIESTVPSAWPILRLIKYAWPEIFCIVLASNIWQKVYAQEIGCDLAVSAMTLSDPKLHSIIQRKTVAAKRPEKQSNLENSLN